MHGTLCRQLLQVRKSSPSAHLARHAPLPVVSLSRVFCVPRRRKVDELQYALRRYHDVPGLDVAMRNPMGVEEGQGREKTTRDEHERRLWLLEDEERGVGVEEVSEGEGEQLEREPVLRGVRVVDDSDNLTSAFCLQQSAAHVRMLETREEARFAGDVVWPQPGVVSVRRRVHGLHRHEGGAARKIHVGLDACCQLSWTGSSPEARNLSGTLML